MGVIIHWKMNKNTDPTVCYLQETHLKSKDTNNLKVKGPKNIFHANCNQHRAGVTILISDKIHVKSKICVRHKGHYSVIKGTI